jgi:GT2 family glycosyltransferase
MNKKQNVVAVIPHYNMPKTLSSLLRQVITQGYDDVYVLDDRSTNCNVHGLIKPFVKTVNLIVGDTNKGAGANRSRILKANLKGALLHFIDADCELLTKNSPEIARKLFSDRSIGAIGGLINNPNGTQMEFNYFPRLSWSGSLSGMFIMASIAAGQKRKQMPKLVRRLLSDYPNPHEPPAAKNVFAVAEANMLIPYDILASVGGFDDSLRFAEAQDLAFKLKAKGLTVRFDPSIAVKHHAVLLPDRNRRRYLLRDLSRLSRKYGVSWK